jgi:hypothetical protein
LQEILHQLLFTQAEEVVLLVEVMVQLKDQVEQEVVELHQVEQEQLILEEVELEDLVGFLDQKQGVPADRVLLL